MGYGPCLTCHDAKASEVQVLQQAAALDQPSHLWPTRLLAAPRSTLHPPTGRVGHVSPPSAPSSHA